MCEYMGRNTARYTQNAMHRFIIQKYSSTQTQANTHMVSTLSYTHCITLHCLCPHKLPSSLLLNAPIATVGALPWHCDENACFINFVTKSMYCIVQQDRQSTSRIPMKSWCCVPVSPQNILEMHAGKNNPRLNLHHLSAHQIISFQVNNFPSSLSFQVGL